MTLDAEDEKPCPWASDIRTLEERLDDPATTSARIFANQVAILRDKMRADVS